MTTRSSIWRIGLLCFLVAVAALSRGPESAAVASLEPPPESTRNADDPPQVTGIAAFHRAGQTFITWKELEPAPPAKMTIAEFRALRQKLTETDKIAYRIYRSSAPVARLADARLVAEVPPLSAWNGEIYGVYPEQTSQVPRYAIQDGGEPVPSGMGLFVYHPESPGTSYYVVTTSRAGVENTAMGAANTVQVSAETVGDGVPVLQTIQKNVPFMYVDGATLRHYVRWEPPANSSVPGRAFDYLVAAPPGLKEPAPVGIHLHEWGGSLGHGFGWWFNAEKGAVLVSTNQIPYDWWTGYHELAGRAPLKTAEDWRKGVVRPYTMNRVLSFVDWVGSTIIKVDRTRVFAGGNSMGGSGSIMFAIRHPERIAWAVSWVGVHVPADSPTFRSSYEGVWGPPSFGVKFMDGTPVWEYFDDAAFLRRHPERDIGFITFSNGKNDGAIGWPQALAFLRALQETRQPHLFVWGQEGHGQRAVMPGGGERVQPLDIRTDRSLPAFTNCSLDDDAGSGSPESGSPQGQVNRFLTWKPSTIVEDGERWMIDIALAGQAPADSATVNVTPRRLQLLKSRPGDLFEWSNHRGSTVAQSGQVRADQYGLITLPKVQISKAGNRITLVRKSADPSVR